MSGLVKVYREQNVLEAARERIALVFDRFKRVFVSVSGGKDSGVLAARRRPTLAAGIVTRSF